MRIGLLGFGTVGRGVYDLTASREDMTVTKVLCRRELTIPRVTVTHSMDDIANDTEIDTVVEVMGGLHPAYEYVRQAILAGKNVVTANKAMVASFYDELIPLARERGVSLRCTAAVGGGIGWLSALERTRRVETVTRISGIMNGTCNYILDSMSRLGLAYSEALHQAQSLGYAEADPSTDIDGIDTWHRLILSANVAFGVSLEAGGVPVAGIRNIRAEDVVNFKNHKYICKLAASAWQSGGTCSAYVEPTLYPEGEPEAAVPTNYNLITLEGPACGRQSFFGQGAGRYPTAYNVVQDCMDILGGTGYYGEYGGKTAVDNSCLHRYYVRGGLWPAERTEQRWGNACVTRPVSVEAMHRWLKGHPDAFIAALPEQDPPAGTGSAV